MGRESASVDPLLIERIPANAKLLTTEGRDRWRSGNLIIVLDEGAPRVLKVYRRRKGALNDFLGGLSHRVLEKKTGTSASERRETEERCLRLWAEAGFDVPKVLEGEAPEWIGALPFLWLEYTPGPTLFTELERDWSTRSADFAPRVQALGAEHARRHRLCLERGEPLLLQEHATSKHVICFGERLVTLDLEGAYSRSHPLLSAVAQELSASLRSLWHGQDFSSGPAGHFLSGYADRELLTKVLEEYFAAGLRGWFKRRDDERRRSAGKTKTSAMEALKGWLAAQT